MKESLRALIVLTCGILAGVGITIAIYPRLDNALNLSGGPQGSEEQSAEKEPLYWVAPMDADYRRDEPGQSPMGMDLVPVYEKDAGGDDTGPGAVRISPDVVNNLGVRTAAAQRTELNSIIRTVGYVGYDEDQLVHVHPRVKGWIEKLYIKASGNPVTKGQPLYDIYSPELVNAQEELLLALNRSSPRLIRAAELRLRALRVPQETITSLKKSRKVQQNITFYSPQSGVVDNLVIREGFYVEPGTNIMAIGTLEQVWVEAEVFERQASRVAIGNEVTMTLDYLPGKVWRGRVDYIYPALDAKTRTVRVRLRFDNEDNLLRPNMFAQVALQADTSEKTLVIPQEAVIRTGRSNRVVLHLGEGRFKSINVKVGRYAQDSAEILSGLREGDEVVTSAQFLIDSESSKTSDFKRMHHEKQPSPPTSIWAQASIHTFNAEKRRVNATHEPIPQWDWPEMTMDFAVAESVELSKIEEGMQLNIEISKTDTNQYEITAIHIPETEENTKLDDIELDDMSLDDMTLE
ncbi:MAG: efflux RND transporter periplasmic adaptor subunit [Desulfopila sp.]